MKRYKADVKVSLQEGVTDPEGNATLSSLKNLGFTIEYVRKASVFSIGGIEAKNKKEAESKVDEMCRKLLSNPVKDEYHIHIEEM